MSRLEIISPLSPSAEALDESSRAVEERAPGPLSGRLTEQEARPVSLETPQPLVLLAADEPQFFWLGILARNATFTAKTASTLWTISVDDAEVILQRWVDQQILVKTECLRANLDCRHNYQIPVSLQQVAYAGLLQHNQLEARDAHAALVERYHALTHKRMWHTLEDDGYIHAHLTWHLQAAERCDEIHILLQEESESGANGWYEACDRNSYTAFYCRDVNIAWQLAEDQYEQSPTQAIQLQCRYAMMTVAHHHMATRLPAGLAGALVRQRVWTPTQGIAYFELIQAPQHQFDVLQGLIPALPNTFHPYVLSVIQHQLSPAHQAQAICLLAPLLDPERFPALLKIIQALASDFYQALVLREISARIPIPLLDQIVAIAQTLSPTDEMVAACGIVTRWPQTVSTYLNQLIRYQKGDIEESVFLEFLIAIAPTVSTAQKAQVLELINAIEHPPTRANILLLLLPNHPGLVSVTFRTICAIEDEGTCGHALSRITPYLSDIEIQLALNILEKFENPLAFRSALQSICEHHSGIGTKVLKLINTLPTERDRGQVLATLYPHLPPSLQSQVKNQINAFTLLTEKSLAFCHLACAEKSMLPTALHWLGQCQDPLTQFQGYWVLSQLRSKFLPAAFTAACEITNLDDQILAFQCLAPHLSPDQIQRILVIAQQATHQDHQQRIIETVIPSCTPALLLSIQTWCNQQHDNQIYASVLSTLKTQLASSELKLSPWEVRKRTLDSLYALLPNDLLAQTLTATLQFTDKVNRAKSLSRLLPQIHPSQIDYSQWCQILHHLTALDYDSFFLIIPKLNPLMEYFAEPAIHHCTVQNMQMIHRQW